MDHSTRIVSFNCEGAARNINCIKYILETISPDLMCIQEAWITTDDMSKYDCLDPSYTAKGKSGIDIEKTIGRPSGGLIIFHKRSLNKHIDIVPCNNKRLYAIKVIYDDNDSTLICNVYMPCDKQNMHRVDDETMDVDKKLVVN